jgi:hypothetical protein
MSDFPYSNSAIKNNSQNLPGRVLYRGSPINASKIANDYHYYHFGGRLCGFGPGSAAIRGGQMCWHLAPCFGTIPATIAPAAGRRADPALLPKPRLSPGQMSIQ